MPASHILCHRTRASGCTMQGLHLHPEPDLQPADRAHHQRAVREQRARHVRLPKPQQRHGQRQHHAGQGAPVVCSRMHAYIWGLCPSCLRFWCRAGAAQLSRQLAVLQRRQVPTCKWLRPTALLAHVFDPNTVCIFCLQAPRCSSTALCVQVECTDPARACAWAFCPQVQHLQAELAAGVAEGLTQMQGLAVRAGQLDEQLSRSLQAEVRQRRARTHALTAASCTHLHQPHCSVHACLKASCICRELISEL